MKSFEIVPHTADTEIVVRGTTLKELFLAALEGMNEIMQPGFCSKGEGGNLERAIALTSGDTTALLIDFLSEVLTASHEEKAVFCEASFQKLAEDSLEVLMRGRRVDAFARDLKAVTYHRASVERRGEAGYETRIVFDI